MPKNIFLSTGYLDSSLPFDELRERSRITGAVKAAENSADFSDIIRDGLPGIQKSLAERAR